ncbi:MAG: hypothetical protein KJ941_01745 [Bacteroidetes bacterium]|nr:hypothetical protein [Bacteroidota bacterium]
MTVKYLILFCLLFSQSIKAQTENSFDKEGKSNYVVGLLPSRKEFSYGLQIGLIGSESFFSLPYTRKSYGVNFQLFGQGIFMLLNPGVFGYESQYHTEVRDLDSLKIYYDLRSRHCGLLLSTFGTFTSQQVGVSISVLSSMGFSVKGLSINGISSSFYSVQGVSVAFVNHAYFTQGVQLGVINKSKHLHGFQFGLWNVNQKRKLPFVNWNFNSKL